MIDAKIKKHLERALRDCLDGDVIIDNGDSGFEFALLTSQCAAAFINELMDKMTIGEKGDFIQEYMLNLSAKEAGLAFGEYLTSERVNPMRELAVDCARKLLDSEDSQQYLADYVRNGGW